MLTFSMSFNLLFPTDKTWSFVRESIFSIRAILLLYKVKSSNCVRLVSPSITSMLLNDKSEKRK